MTGEQKDFDGDLDVGMFNIGPYHKRRGQSDEEFFHKEKDNADGGESLDAECFLSRRLFFHLRHGRPLAAVFFHEPEQPPDELEDQQKRHPADQQQVEIDQPTDTRTRFDIPGRPPIVRRSGFPGHIPYLFILFRHSQLNRFVICCFRVLYEKYIRTGDIASRKPDKLEILAPRGYEKDVVRQHTFRGARMCAPRT